MKEKWCIVPDGGGLGDYICLISAMRHFARCSIGMEIGIDSNHPLLVTLVSLYDDNPPITKWARSEESLRHPFTTPETIGFADKEVKWKVFHNINRLATDNPGIFGNLAGLFLAQFFNFIPSIPSAPELPKTEGILKGKIGFQYQASSILNSPDEFTQRIIDLCKEYTGEDVIALGLPNPPNEFGLRHLKNVNFDYLKNDIHFLMSCINGLGLLLTPRSAPAVIAATYQTPTILWEPNDQGQWMLNFSPWNVLNLKFESPFEENKIRKFIKDTIK